MEQLVEALRYKLEHLGFDSPWEPNEGPCVDSASNRSEYQGFSLGCKGGRCVGLTTLPPLCTDCIEILGGSTSWTPTGLCRGNFYRHPKDS